MGNSTRGLLKESRRSMTADITIYGADWCGDCRRAKQYLAKNEIAYAWVDVEANPEEIETVMRYNDGRKNIPVVVFADGTHLTEPSDADLDAKLGR
jgi:mycoredoxin